MRNYFDTESNYVTIVKKTQIKELINDEGEIVMPEEIQAVNCEESLIKDVSEAKRFIPPYHHEKYD